jgi:AcrR family transcriptional regulator
MPNETFLNLPIDKRTLIETVAIDEFAEYGFDNASINRIVKAAKIAKGSFYQYFADKADVYTHILTVISEKKVAYVTPVLSNPFEHDFFTLLEDLYRSGLEFAKDNPKATVIGFEMFKNKTNSIFHEMLEASKKQANQFYGALLSQAITNGEVDPSIDIPFVIHMLITMQLASIEYFFDIVDNDEISPESFGDGLMPTVNLMISFIKNGIQLQK